MKIKLGSQFPITLLLLFSKLTSSSQTVTNITGNTIQNSALVIEYSIGEITVSTLTGVNAHLTQGLLQPNLKVLNASCDVINSEILTFENPTRNMVRLVGQYDWITDYEIYAADGKLIKQSKFYNNHIDISQLPAALYFIKLFPGCNGNYRVIKVVKQ